MNTLTVKKTVNGNGLDFLPSQKKETVLRSVKLPRNINQLFKKDFDRNTLKMVSGALNVNKADDSNIFIIPDKIIREKLKQGQATLTRDKQYRMDFTIRERAFEMPKVLEEIQNYIAKFNFRKINFLPTSYLFLINGTSYNFYKNAYKNELVLKSIDKNGIGIMTEEKRDMLLSGDLSFCSESVCYRQWKSHIICE